MDLQASKLELVKRIIDIDNPLMIDSLLSVLKQADEKKPCLSDSDKQEIRLGLKQLDRGERISMEAFLEKHK